jgi:TatD DNase family protein
MIIVDSHCHLNYFPDSEAVIARARENDVCYIQNICTKLSEFETVYQASQEHDHIFSSVGIHPNEAEKHESFKVDDLLRYAARPKVIGLGETGLDYYYEYSKKEVQKESFYKHIIAAQETGLPLIIHTRDAEEDTIEIMRSSYKERPFSAVIHCFTGSMDLAKAMLELGFYISISGIITFKNASNLREIVQALPLDRILIETDAPYLAPVPHRGKQNEPAYTRLVGETVAELKNKTLEEIAQITTSNFFRLFNKTKIFNL